MRRRGILTGGLGAMVASALAASRAPRPITPAPPLHAGPGRRDLLDRARARQAMRAGKRMVEAARGGWHHFDEALLED